MRSFSNWLSRFANCRLERQLLHGRRLERQLLHGRRLERQGSTTSGDAPSPSKAGESIRGHAVADCELQWRPSRWLALALILQGVLGGVSAWASELSQPLSLPIAGLALIWAIASARRELRRPARPLVIRGGHATLAGESIGDLRLHWRGWLARLDFTGPDGRRQRLLWWPDTLDAAGRRELRLAVAVIAPARDTRSVAP
jgi:toxin CptA